jgi:acyl-CoA synthetase (AMP-forming)/AMP-acid ligase II
MTEATQLTRSGRVGRIQPFDGAGIERGADGVLHYQGLHESLVHMLRATVDEVPGGEAVVEVGGPRLSYRQLWDRAARVAGGLRAQGVRRGDRVAIQLGNGLDWVLAFFGIELAGAVAVPVNTRFTEPEVRYVVEDSGAAYVFRPGEALPDGEPHAEEGLGPGDVAAIFYTSGTTGFPKGAMTTHENFLSNVETCLRVVEIPRHDVRNLVSVPLFHVTGCNSQLLPTVRQASTTVIMPAFEVQAFLSTIREERINLLTSVPAVFWLAMAQPNFGELDTSNIRWLTYGGAPCPPELIRGMRQGFPNAQLGNGFGLTETSSVATFLPDRYTDARPETVGFAAPVVELDVCEPDAEGVGELLVRAPNVVAGYWNKPEATQQAFVDHWLHTGDLVRIDDDGFVQIVDRKKDMINRGGENVYSVEVENAVMEHPGVFEVAVLGVPDTMMGEKVGAVVVPKPGVAPPTPKEIADFARQRIADFKVPQYVVIRPAPLPRNPGGKVLKPLLRDETEWGSALR